MQRAGLGITRPDAEPTDPPLPATRPVGQVDTSDRFTHSISFSDEATPERRAKPEGVRGCEIWVKVGGVPPADSSECHYLATDTRSPYVAHYAGSDAGKMAHYLLR